MWATIQNVITDMFTRLLSDTSVGSTVNLIHATTDFKLRYGTDDVVIDADGDEAGKRVAWDTYKQLSNQKILPIIIQRPRGDAADELAHLLQPENTSHRPPQTP